MIKVAITDDHEMVLKGLQQMLTEDPGIDLTGVYLNGKDLLEGLAKTVPDVLLLDLHLPDKTGAELAREILSVYPSLKIMVLSGSGDIKHVKEMMQIGCKGYSLKNIAQKTLLTAITQLYQGEHYLTPALKEGLFRESITQAQLRPSYVPEVTRREKQVLKMLAAGCRNKDIADQLFISVRTVENHRTSLMRKFDVNNALALINAAKQKGILE